MHALARLVWGKRLATPARSTLVAEYTWVFQAMHVLADLDTWL